MTYNDKQKIKEHYDFVSPYYRSLWGEHLHHGYWVTGKETKDEAQLALTEHLIQVSKIKSGSRILDVGCGFGASSIYLAKKYNAKTTGITISQIQVDMANKEAANAQVDSNFVLMDAENMIFDESFDVVWSIESISHYKNKKNFFLKATELLKSGGTIAIIDWFKKENLSPKDYKEYIQPIEKGMLVELHTVNDYISILELAGLEIVEQEDISKNTSKTWDITSSIIKNKKFWWLAFKQGKDIINFLLSFRAMRRGFSSKNFVYGLIVARKK